ncbi:AraC family transcriptional regulator [Xylanibacillus composti]|uniref:AraC family transcriptional regulator n=1 Tax=Xylanibacillus composti TaxID=1572762 RepID=A0A8J4H904_9BACL|nr:helix-turn-helix domain-containing protein [Xylanibacillus composti]GIQ71348.1 AraC family transcriptional regulator [Xylanibacillus composti]
MIYHAYAPRHPALQPYIQQLWHISQAKGDALEVTPRMLPDGCYHMVVNLGAPHRYIDRNGRAHAPKRTHMNARHTDYVTVQRSGEVEIMGVVFQPYGLYPFVRLPMKEVAGAVRDMEDLLGPRVREMEERLYAASTVRHKLLELEACLLSFLSPEHEVKREVVAASQMLRQRHGLMTVRGLLHEFHLSERTLERYFQHDLGMSPKQFANIQRMQYVLQVLKSSPQDKLVHAAMDGEFYDQAHFIHTFKKMVGMTPQAYLRTQDLLSDLYNPDAGQAGKIEWNGL